MDEKKKQSIAIGIGTTTIVSIGGILGYYYYKKIKEQARIDKLATEGEKEYLDEREMSDLLVGDMYNNNRINKDKIRSKFEVYGINFINKIYKKPSSRQRDRTEDLLTEDLERLKRNRNRSRFGSNYSNVSDRFKILETVGDKSVEVRGTKRLRVSGNIHKRTEGGYSGNMNNRNVNLSDLQIPNNMSRKRVRKRVRNNLIYP